MDRETFMARIAYDKEHPCKEKLTFSFERHGDNICIEDDETNIYHHQRISIPIEIFLQIQSFLENCPIRGSASSVFYEETEGLASFARYQVEVFRGNFNLSRCAFRQEYTRGSAADHGDHLHGDFDLILKFVDYEVPDLRSILDDYGNDLNYFED